MRRACEGVNTVFHIASLVSTFGSIEPFLRINVLGECNFNQVDKNKEHKM